MRRPTIPYLLVALSACGSGTPATPAIDAPVTAGPDAPTAPAVDAPAPPDARIDAQVDAQTVSVDQALGVPSDITQVNYPTSYQAAPKTLTAIDPYCGVTQGQIVFPASYIGAFPLPPITGAPMPASVGLSIEMKDFWLAGLNNPALVMGCMGSIHEAFAATVTRLARLKAGRVSVSSFDFIFDVNAAQPAFDASREQINADELVFIGQTAKAAGLGSIFYMQLTGADDNGVALPSAPTTTWFGNLMDAYTARLLGLAAAAQTGQVDAMSLNWIEYYVDFGNHPDLEAIFVAKMQAALAQMRAIYKGRIIYIDNGTTPLTPGLTSLIQSVDDITVALPTAILSSDEDQNVTVALVKGKYMSFIAGVNDRLKGFGKPIVLNSLIQSHRHFLVTGWIEDAPFSECDGDCVEKHLSIDFSVQAIAYEGLLEAIAAEVAAGVTIGFVEANYWYTDQIMAYGGMWPNMAQTTRNKPAEAILRAWFNR
jgi:hypothetical protein